MNVENTSSEGVTDIIVKIKVEEVSENDIGSDIIDLYADHVIKDEMVIGPVVLQPVVYTAYRPEDVPVPKKPKLEITDEATDQVKPQKGMKEDNTEGFISNVDFAKNSSTSVKTNTTSRNNEQIHNYNLRKHDQTPKLAENVFICNDCGKKFYKKYTLAQHILCHQKIGQGNNLKYKEHTYQTGSQDSLEQHFKLHDKDSFECDLCGYRSEEKCKLLKHLKFKHSSLKDLKKKIYACSVCACRCAGKGSLTTHLRTHTGEKPYSCARCDYKCKYKSHLLRHLLIHNGEKRYSCTRCDYKCTLKSYLLRHLRIHNGEKPYSCAHCDYTCIRKSNLSVHLRIHNGDEPYSCSVCDYKCKHKNNLLRHLRTHTGEKPYSCTHCDFKCSQKSDLLVHLRTHTGEKPYSCSHCDYKCSQKCSLSRHLRIHNGEKPFSCVHCDYKCNQKSHLLRHLRTHTAHTREKPYSCTHCGYKSAFKSCLARHFHNVHKLKLIDDS